MPTPNNDDFLEPPSGDSPKRKEDITDPINLERHSMGPRIPEISSPKEIVPGTKLGAYVVQEFLGRGGFGYVFKARHEKSQKVVAIKVGNLQGGGQNTTKLSLVQNERTVEGISADEITAGAYVKERRGVACYTCDRALVDRLIYAEAERLNQLTPIGPQFRISVSCYEVIEVFNGRPAIVMEFVKGETLREKIRKMSGVHLNWLVAIAKSLDQLGSHGDLKPENIIIDELGAVKLIDPRVDILDKKISVVTPEYNPLLLDGYCADIFSMGVMMYEVLTGTLPYHDVPWEHAGKRVFGKELGLSRIYYLSCLRPSDLNTKCPKDLEVLIYKALYLEEYSMSQFLADITEIIRKG